MFQEALGRTSRLIAALRQQRRQERAMLDWQRFHGDHLT
jgi:hypothetical protein